jgi:RNA polymerase sigma factor (sigma-70 family)
MDKYIFELIDIVQKGNKDKVINLLIIFQNQIKSYSKKAHSEDIEQDLYVFLIHLIYTISLDKMRSIDDKTLMSYISRSIKFYFYKCFKKQYILSNNELTFINEINYENMTCISEDKTFSDLEFISLLKDLTDKKQNVIIQKYKYGFSTSEIAKKSNVSVQAVYKLEKNALKKLKKLL